MAIEIEKKFLVDIEKWAAAKKGAGDFYRQGYLLTDPSKTVRVRRTNDAGFITIKGLTVGASRPEFEYNIPIEDADALLNNFCDAVVAKHRYKVEHEGKLWEVDEFDGDNDGLIVAEIELSSEAETFALPEWVTTEVTDDARYYNANLSRNPFCNWKS